MLVSNDVPYNKSNCMLILSSKPDRPVLITNSSLLPSNPSTPEGLSAYLFPSFRYVPKIEPDAQGLESFIQTYVEEHSPTANSVPITMPTVFICGHGGRDKRCGIMGPLLQSEFETQLRRVGIPTTNSPPALDEGSAVESKARVGLISHIGGHKWAGNVIIYLPQDPTGVNQLAGKAIWYGRVEPKHVEGIVKETILGGTIINELCRGLI